MNLKIGGQAGAGVRVSAADDCRDDLSGYRRYA